MGASLSGMKTLGRTLSILAVSALVLAGCGEETGGSDDDSTPTTTESPTPSPDPTDDTTVDPPDGDTVTGNGYSFVLPDGWIDATAEFQDQTGQIDSAAREEVPTEDYSNNVNIIATPIPQEFTTQELLDQQLSELQGFGEIEDSGITQFAGEEASYAVLPTNQEGVEYRVHQLFVQREGTVYVMSFAFRLSTDNTEASDIIAQIESGFAWQ